MYKKRVLSQQGLFWKKGNKTTGNLDIEGVLLYLAKCWGVDPCDRVIRIDDQVTGQLVEISVQNGVLVVDSDPSSEETYCTYTYTIPNPAVQGTGTLTMTAGPLDGETVVIGTKTYTYEDTLTDVDGHVKIAPGTAASSVLTLTGQPLDTETVVIDGRTYTFLTVFVDAADNVNIGATASDSIDNLISAITGVATGGAVAGTDFPTVVVAHASVTAAQGVGDTMDVTALVGGVPGNSITTTETLTNGSFTGATLAGGDSDASDSIDNLIAAIGLGAGAGTAYAASTTINTDVTAVAGVGDTMDVTSILYGVSTDTIATTETGGNMSWAAADLVYAGTVAISVNGNTVANDPFEITSSGVTSPSADTLASDLDTLITAEGVNPIATTAAVSGLNYTVIVTIDQADSAALAAIDVERDGVPIAGVSTC